MEVDGMRLSACFLLSLLLAASLLSPLAKAQISTDAGELHFNVSAGYNETLQTSVSDSSPNITINFYIVRPTFQQLSGGAVPVMNVSPLNGTLRPLQSRTISMTVFMPSGTATNATWKSVIEVIQAPTPAPTRVRVSREASRRR